MQMAMTKNISFRPQFNEKVIKTSKNVGCLKQQDGVQTQNFNKTKFELFRWPNISQQQCQIMQMMMTKASHLDHTSMTKW